MYHDWSQHCEQRPYSKAKKYMCVSGFSSEKTRYARRYVSFYQNILYRKCIFHFIFRHFFSIFDNILLTIHNKMFRVGEKKKQVGSGNLKHIYFWLKADAIRKSVKLDQTAPCGSGTIRTKTSSSWDDSTGMVRTKFRTGLFAQITGTRVRSKYNLLGQFTLSNFQKEQK